MGSYPMNQFRPGETPPYQSRPGEAPRYQNEPGQGAGPDIYAILAQLLGAPAGGQRSFPPQGGQPPLGFGLEMSAGGWPAAEQRALLADPRLRARLLGPGNVPAPFSMSPGLFGFGR